MSKSSVDSYKITRIHNFTDQISEQDLIAVEEPLEIRLGYGNESELIEKRISITMRTPGNDFELALGFLFNEGIIKSLEQVKNIRYCHQVEKEEEKENVVKVTLRKGELPDLQLSERNFYTNSSCGVCGKSAIESIQIKNCFTDINKTFKVKSSIINTLPAILRKEQSVFQHTGGLHASGLFNTNGEILMMREDVGRHNALDKLVGAAINKFTFPLDNNILLLSGRISFELVQKAISAGIQVIAAIGAPSSLAVSLAQDFDLTLIGFLKEKKFNIYSGESRIVLE